MRRVTGGRIHGAHHKPIRDLSQVKSGLALGLGLKRDRRGSWRAVHHGMQYSDLRHGHLHPLAILHRHRHANHAIIKKKKNSNDGDDGPMVPTTLYIVTATPTPVPHHLVTWHQDDERPSHWQTQCSSLPLPSSHWQVSSNSAPIPGTN